MSKQTFHLPTWRRKPTADETAPDIADSELVPSEHAARHDAPQARQTYL